MGCEIKRRFFNGALAALAGGAAMGMRNADAQSPNSSSIDLPELQAPAGACDSHIHIFDNRFNASSRTETNARVSDYRLVQQRIGTSRTVMVTPRPYRTDNRCTLDAIQQLGLANARGVAVVSADIKDAELMAMSAGGIRGVRFSLHDPSVAVTEIGMVETVARRVGALGWHVQMHMGGDQIVEAMPMLQRLECPIVLDHMGRTPQPAGISDRSFDAVRWLLDAVRVCELRLTS